jgi:hypothetical protein
MDRGEAVSAPVEVTVRYATTVDTLPGAWAFVMARLDDCGQAPCIDIKPVWSSSDDFTAVRFTVVVAGMTEEGETT